MISISLIVALFVYRLFSIPGAKFPYIPTIIISVIFSSIILIGGSYISPNSVYIYILNFGIIIGVFGMLLQYKSLELILTMGVILFVMTLWIIELQMIVGSAILKRYPVAIVLSVPFLIILTVCIYRYKKKSYHL